MGKGREMAALHARTARYMTTVAIGALMAGIPPAFAQEATQATNAKEIMVMNRIVLGAGREKVAIETPQAVTVIDQEDLDSEQASSINRVFENVPGVQGTGGDNMLGFAFNIRGMGKVDDAAGEARIIVNVDGVPKFYEQYRMGNFFSDVEMYKQVEVLRGPGSSTLYGTGAIGGVVNFTTKDAADFIKEGKTSALRFKAGYESNGDSWLGSVIYATRLGDNFEVLGNFNYRTTDDYKDGDGKRVVGSNGRAWSGLLKGTYYFGDGNEQSLRFSYQRFQSSIDDGPLVRTGGNFASTFGNVDRDTTDDTFIVAYENPVSGNPWLDYTLQFSYSNTQVEQHDAEFAFMCNPSAVSTMNVMCDVTYAYETYTVKAENTFELSSGAWENYITTGIQFSHQNRKAESDAYLTFHPEGENQKIGVYAQGEFIWNDRLTIMPGLRIDFASRKPDASIPNAQEVDDTAVSPKIAVLYKLTDNWGVFGTLARTERMPTLDELFSYDATRPASLDLDKETADSVEVGVSYSTFGLLNADDSLQLKATLFKNDIENMIVSGVAGLGQNRYVNVDEAEIWGGELEGSYSAERWFARVAYSNITARNKKTKVPLSTVPADTFALTLGGRLPEYGVEYGWRGTFVSGVWSPDLTSTSGALKDHPSYDLHRVFVSWRPDSGFLEGFRVDFSVDNIFDETFRNNLYLDNGRGRTFNLSLTKQLDW